MRFKKVLDLTKNEAMKFLNSFDNVLFDFDGVICLYQQLIPGANDAANKFRSLGKTIRFVTNNSYVPFSKYLQTFERLNIQAEEHELINQTKAVSSYLKRINFNKELLAISSQGAIDYYRSQGIKVYEMPNFPNVTLDDVVNEKRRKEVGAVLMDLTFDYSYEKLCRTQIMLLCPEVLFLVGVYDDTVLITKEITMMTPKPFVDATISAIGRQPIYFCKPSEEMKKFVFKNLNIKDPSRTLFIGDSLQTDMEFATRCGFQKLLVLSGVTKMENLNSCKKSSYPDYVADSLQDVAILLNNINLIERHRMT